jgi:hypothetical protein
MVKKDLFVKILYVQGLVCKLPGTSLHILNKQRGFMCKRASFGHMCTLRLVQSLEICALAFDECAGPWIQS